MQDSKNKTRILIVDVDATVRKGLMQLVNEQADIGSCFEAKNANQALETIKKQRVDLAIVSTSEDRKKRFQPSEEIKLHYPNLPVLMLSKRDRESCVESTPEAGAKSCIANQKAGGRVMKAVHYAQSLLSSGIHGFSLLVEIERGPGDDG